MGFIKILSEKVKGDNIWDVNVLKIAIKLLEENIQNDII
jgi:hypothetical protein